MIACLYVLTMIPICLAGPVGYMVKYEMLGNGALHTPSHGVHSLHSRQIDDSEQPTLRFEDNLGIFEWRIAPTYLAVQITNRAGRGSDRGSERWLVMLESAEFIGGDGRGRAVVPILQTNVRRVIRPGESQTYFVFPTDYLRDDRALFGGPIPNFVAASPEEIRRLYGEHVGERLQFHLPVQVGQLVYSYRFEMTVSEVYPYLASESF